MPLLWVEVQIPYTDSRTDQLPRPSIGCFYGNGLLETQPQGQTEEISRSWPTLGNIHAPLTIRHSSVWVPSAGRVRRCRSASIWSAVLRTAQRTARITLTSKPRRRSRASMPRSELSLKIPFLRGIVLSAPLLVMFRNHLLHPVRPSLHTELVAGAFVDAAWDGGWQRMPISNR